MANQRNPFYANPLVCVVVLLLVSALGVYQFLKLPVALYPDTTQPRVYLWVNSLAMTAAQFRSQYGKSLEEAISGVDGVVKVVGKYGQDYANYEIDFRWGLAADVAKTNVKAAVDPIGSRFPRHWDPMYVEFRGQHSSRFFYSLSSDQMNAKALSQFMQQQLNGRLRAIPGLADLWTMDWSKQRIQIDLLPDRLAQFGIGVDEVFNALSMREVNEGLGVLRAEGAKSTSVILTQRAQDLADLKATVIATHGASRARVTIAQVANFRLEADNDKEVLKTNGVRSMLVGGYVKPDANIKQVADDFKRILIAEVANYSGTKIKVEEILSPAEFIDHAISNVLHAVLAGVVITLLITFLFLGSFTDTLVVCLTIPLAGLGGFILMRLLGIEINLISMGAMALAVGMVVDGATVVLENIVRVVEEQKADAQTLYSTIQLGTKQVYGAVVASLMTTIIVFLPLPFTTPLAAAVLGDLAIVIICVMVVSLVVTIYIIPPVIFHLYQYRRSHPAKLWQPVKSLLSWFEHNYKTCETFYLFLLDRLLKVRKLRFSFYGLCTVLFFVGIGLLLFVVRREIISEPETNKVFAFIDIKETQMAMPDREKLIDSYDQRARKKLKSVIVNSISRVTPSDSFILFTIPSSAMMSEFKQELLEILQDTPTIKFRLGDWSPTSLELPAPPIYRLNVSGNSEEERRTRLAQLEESLRKSEKFGAIEFHPTYEKERFVELSPKPVFAGSVNSGQVGSRTPSLTSISESLKTILNVRYLYNLQTTQDSYGVYLGTKSDLFRNANDLANIHFRSDGQLVPLRAIYNIASREDYPDIYTTDGQFKAFVDVWPKLEHMRQHRDRLRKRLNGVLEGLPDHLRNYVAKEDMDREISENLISLSTALLLSLGLIVLVLVFQFSSMRAVIIVMSAIPLGILGCGAALSIFQSSLSINSILGLILLGGTAVNNSIVLVDFYLTSTSGFNQIERICDAARLRLRPILITALTTVLGMLPVALGWGEGAKILQPLGITVSAGLGISTFLTLLVVPCLLLDLPLTKTNVNENAL